MEEVVIHGWDISDNADRLKGLKKSLAWISERRMMGGKNPKAHAEILGMSLVHSRLIVSRKNYYTRYSKHVTRKLLEMGRELRKVNINKLTVVRSEKTGKTTVTAKLKKPVKPSVCAGLG